MKLTQYVRVVRKWLWFIVLAAILVGGVAFIFRSGQRSNYQAQATVAIGHYINAPNPDSSEILTGISLAQTYAELVTTHDVLQGVIDALSLKITIGELKQRIDKQIVAGTSLLVIKVSYEDPVVASDIANALAEQLIAKSPSNLTPEQASQVNLANQQIAALNQQIDRARQHITDLDKALAAATAEPEAAATLTAQQDALTAQINQAAATIAQFTTTIASLQQRTNSLDIVERAQVPTQPSGASVTLITILGAILGMAIAYSVGLIVDYTDTAVRTTERAIELLHLPIWGTIMRFGKRRDPYPKRLITNQQLPRAVQESYRSLRTNLIFSHEDMNKVYVVTSPGPVEGKSVTAANLAISIANAGLRVLLIDADLRRPKVNEIFGLPNDVGLTTLLFANPLKLNQILSTGATEEKMSSVQGLKNTVKKTGIPKLQVIPCGYIPPNPAELLGSTHMRQWVDAFRASDLIDIIIIDTPPALVVSDASILAANVKANVILVLNAPRTRRTAALKTKEQFDQVGSPVSGVVLNEVHPRDEDYGLNYGYYYDVPKDQAGAKTDGKEKKT